MLRTRMGFLAGTSAVLAALVLAGARVVPPEEPVEVAEEAVAKGTHVPEVLALLSDLKIDAPRTHKNMVVFPIRWGGKQAPGKWETLDDAVAAGHLKVSEKDQATVPKISVENTGDVTVLLMSGEIVKGGKQTRAVRKDTIVEPKQQVALTVFCVEQRRWAGSKTFDASSNMAPSSIRDAINRGGDQAEVWTRGRATLRSLGAESATESLDEGLNSEKVQDAYKEAHEDFGQFSPPDTVGIAVADARTGRVVGLELFGRRDLFERLQDKLVEGYTTDLVLAAPDWNEAKAKEVTKKDVEDFVRRAVAGKSQYEDTPGSGRGIDLVSGTLRGKGVALGRHVIHLSIQDVRPAPTPARPIVDDDPRPLER